ncbi:MAG: HAMP domain-containing histidine kinase [Desulfovibrio sp.]|jgi:signal transduction histidine kinase|nr:HAMP domain-containing histidine kinase [Desulfovibrio sp.]
MRKRWPFTRLFTVSFTLITALTVTVFIFFGLRIIDRFFSYYVDKVHEETQHMLVMQAAAHYKMFGTWNSYDGAEIGAAAKLSGDYFTLTDNQGNTVYTSEKDVERCCANRNHMYTRVTYPVLVEEQPVGELTAGYFSNHITSPEADAFRGSGVSLVILAILCISLSGALVSILFFYRLSKPIRDIAATAKEISKGHLQSRVSIKSNVSEMHEIADSINALGDSLLNQEKFRQQLIVELSHELRTPLQILINQIEAMLDGIYKADKSRLDSMHAEIARTGELLNELEDRLIYENDTFELNIATTDISTITTKVALGHEGGFAQRGLEFVADIEPDILVDADSVRYAQVLINLLSNAQKYTAEGSISLSLKREGGAVELIITDTGEGIAPEVIGNINSRSVQSFKAVNSKGVGLYITKLIIDKHGWKFHIDSEINAGTRIRVIM